MMKRLPVIIVILMFCVALAGCGTTQWTDTRRSATEQLLISDAMDRAVSRLDFRALAGRTVYVDDTPLKGITDSAYLVSLLRQHMLASGCAIKSKETEADYIVEVRSGAVGTDRNDLVYGVPAVNIPALIPVGGFGIPSQIPEMPFIKKTHQRAVAKIAVFAFNRQTGRPVWQSGVVSVESDAKDVWVFGAGPFQRGSIYEGVNFAGNKLKIPLIDLGRREDEIDPVSVADEAYFVEPEAELAQDAENAPPAGASSKVVPTAHTQPPPEDEAARTPPAKSPSLIRSIGESPAKADGSGPASPLPLP